MGTQKRPHEDWAVEAKEFLRKMLIGRGVNVRMEYNRKIPPQSGESLGLLDALLTGIVGSGDVLILMFGNVTVKNSKGDDVNVAEAVVENGFASLAKHRTDEERSSIYDRLLAADEKAKTAKVGMHCGKEPPKNRINDISNQEGLKRAKDRLSSLERNGKMQGLVEAVMSGHRMKIKIPREGLLIAFALAGIKAPMRAQPAREGQKKGFKVRPAIAARSCRLEEHLGGALCRGGNEVYSTPSAAEGSDDHCRSVRQGWHLPWDAPPCRTTSIRLGSGSIREGSSQLTHVL